MSNKQKFNQPSFWAPIKAFLRQGHKELTPALKAFPDSLPCVEEPGMLGNPTMQMVTAEMGTLNSFDQVLDHYASQGHQEPELDREEDR